MIETDRIKALAIINKTLLQSKSNPDFKNTLAVQRRALNGECGRCIFGELGNLESQRPRVVCLSPRRDLKPPEVLYADLDLGNTHCPGFSPVKKESE